MTEHTEKDARIVAENLRKWSKAIKLPSGDFFNEDLEDAAEMLENYAAQLAASQFR